MILIERDDCRPVALRDAANLLQALAHPIRLQILDVLRRQPSTVTDVVEHLGLVQPVVSRHLAVLRREGVVRVEPRGRERVYRVEARRVAPLLAALFDDEPNPTGAAA